MATLHIEHPITDLSTWLEAFATFEQARTNAGGGDAMVARGCCRVCTPMLSLGWIYSPDETPFGSRPFV